MRNRSLLVIALAIVFSAIAEVVVNAIDSVLLALVMLIILPIVTGSIAGWLAVPGRAGCLVVVLSIATFFVTGAIISSGSRSASGVEELVSYVVLGVIMTFFGLAAYLGLRNTTGASKARELD